MVAASLGHRVVIVGAGPRAIVLLDRLGAHAARTGRVLAVTLVDPYPAGAGRVWNTLQPRALLNNTSVSDTTVFCDDSIRSAAAIDGGPSLYEWCRTIAREHADDRVRHDAAHVEPWSKPPRALQGEYYLWALREVIDRHRCTLRVDERRARAERLSFRAGPRVVLDDGDHLDADAVVLSMGFVDDEIGHEESVLAQHAAEHGFVYRAPGPVDSRDPLGRLGLDLNRPLLARGLGATFFDLLGLIEQTASEGAPALLVAGSASGLPKRSQPDGAGPEIAPARLTATAAAQLLEAHAGRGTADDETIWTWVQGDLRDAYERHARAAGASAEDFDWLDVAAPRQRHGEDFDDTLTRFFSQEAVTLDAPDRSPWAAVRRAVMELRPRVLSLLNAGAFSADAAFRMRSRFLQPAGRLTSGPPASRQALLRRWHDEGRVRLLGPGSTFSPAERGFIGVSPARPGAVFEADQLVEARQSFGSIEASSSLALRTLVRDGHAESVDSAGGGGLRIDAADHRLLSPGGGRPACWVAGHLARSTQLGVNQGAIPHSGDPFLQESDAIAAAIVRALPA